MPVSYLFKPYNASVSKAHYLRPAHSRGLLLKGPGIGIMDFQLHHSVTIHERSFNVLVAPRQLFIEMLNRNLNMQRFKVLYVTGNYSGILRRLHRKFTELEIRRRFTTFQLITMGVRIFRTNYHAQVGSCSFFHISGTALS
jgi:hypothetical protein